LALPPTPPGLLFLFAQAAAAPATAPPPAIAVELRAEVTRAELEAHLRHLASDELAGRATGSPGIDAAGRYLARVLELSGVRPAGDEGTFFQRVPLARAVARDAPKLRIGTVDGVLVEAVAGRDYDPPGQACEVEGLRVHVARTASDVPQDAGSGVALFLDAATTARRREWLSGAGHADGRGFGLLLLPGSAKAGAEDPAPRRSGRVVRAGGDGPPTLRLRGPLLERLRQGEIARVSFSAGLEREAVEAFNVVGRIAGAGRGGRGELAREVVVLSAHYDHLPVREPRPGRPASADDDRIFNGADDDASGCVALLEIAGALAAGPPPARTVIVLLATAEEIGLLGTEEYLERPAEPLERTVANLNFEMLGRPDPLVGGAGRVWLTGHELTTLGGALEAAGLPIVADARPDQNFFQRSDNFAFVRRGIVGQTFSTYNLHADYHTPDDEVERIDFAHLEACAAALLAATRLVLEADAPPRWIEGRAGRPPPR